MGGFATARASYKIAYRCVKCGAVNTSVAYVDCKDSGFYDQQCAENYAWSSATMQAKMQAWKINRNTAEGAKDAYPDCGRCQCTKCSHRQPWGNAYIQARADFNIDSPPSSDAGVMYSLVGILCVISLVVGELAGNPMIGFAGFVIAAVLALIVAAGQYHAEDAQEAARKDIAVESRSEIEALVAVGITDCLPIASAGKDTVFSVAPDDPRVAALSGFETDVHIVSSGYIRG